jgi:4-amino-4-deoxy-L-arabinose transferase-like glycosyltransferase
MSVSPEGQGGPSARNRQLVLLFCFVIPALLRLGVVLLVPWQPYVDDSWYLDKAIHLAHGQGYYDMGHITAYFPVGYPALLAGVFQIFGATQKVAQGVNVVLSVATIVLVYRIALQLAGRRTAILAALLIGYLPNQIGACVVSMSEIPCVFFVTLGILLALRRSSGAGLPTAALSGLSFGAATLIRPPSLFIGFFALVLIGVFKDRQPLLSRPLVARLLVFGVGLAAVLSPWAYRNHRVFGRFILVSTNGGDNLLIGNNPKANGGPLFFGIVYPPEYAAEKLAEADRDLLGARLGKEYILSHPLRTVALAPRKLWQMYRSDLGVTNWLWEQNHRKGTVPYYLCQALTEGIYLFVLMMGFAGMVYAGRRGSRDLRFLALFGFVLTAYLSAICVVFFGDSRFHQPLMPFFAILAAAALLPRLDRFLPKTRISL